MVVDVAKVRVVMWMSSHRVLLFDWKKCFVTIACLELFESSCGGEHWMERLNPASSSLSAPHTLPTYPTLPKPLPCATQQVSHAHIYQCVYILYSSYCLL